MAYECFQYGLPSKFEERTECENCGAELTDKNKPKYCTACGESGCQKCLRQLDDSCYICQGLECYDEYYLKFRAILDDVVHKLHRFITNAEQEKGENECL